EIVVGDIVLLNSGDKIPADGYLIKGSLSVDESALNGETKEAKKESTYTSEVNNKNKVYRGSVVYAGEAFMKVTLVGDNTIYGKISQELQEKVPESPLKIKLRGLANTISKIGYIGAFLASLSYLFSVIVLENQFDLSLIIATITDGPTMFSHFLYALTLSVTIIVVAVPEGLPMMITLVLSSNMKKMLKDNVLVRKLVGIETAGSLNVLLTDKTGTLTKGILKVSDFITADQNGYKTIESIQKFPKYYELLYTSIYYNTASYYSDGKIIGGNSTERALLGFIEKNSKIMKKVVLKEPFDSAKKYSSVTMGDGTIFIKGAAEVVLPKCRKYMTITGEVKTLIDKKGIERKINSFTTNAGRVLVFAYGTSKENLTYLGFVNIKDELREEAKEGISLIKSAGIHPIMITGDAKDTALSIAKEVGLYTSLNKKVLTSEELGKLSDEQIRKMLYDIVVIARALPQDKSRLVSIVESMDLVVGMTGDGVNDAPALKKANVGFAMGSGTDVAKEAADIVILDNNILSISKAVLYGRTIFKSIRKFIIYQLSVNMCALVLSILGSFIGVSTPITIVQMLWLNMIMDTFAGMAFSFESPLPEFMKEKPKGKDTPIMNKYMYSQIIWAGTYSAILCMLFLKLPIIRLFIRTDAENKFLMTAYFALFIYLGIFNAFNARTERINVFANLLKNKVFLGIFTFIFFAQLYIIYYGKEVFRTYGLTGGELVFVLCLALTVFPIDWLRKYILKKKGIKIGV
ncbi:MAG: calcium-translocating P-type ATPase, PMCA-type, partial [Bacilli bacterium]|nr:calcium-translocating P-type ATPase, PMCA-type [Bacilli bacterium]